MGKRYEFAVSITPNTVREIRYCYAPKPILKILNNPKRLKVVI
ncbi:MAG: hypothetical protein OXC46_02350 [Thaumarchaeota archaeon]|nr:hypothetical protein [Nitrososphaerota archaeon]